MRRRTLLASPFLSAIAPAFAHPPEAPRGAEAERMIEEVKVVRDKLAKAVTGKTLVALRATYHDTFTHTHDTGKIDNKEARIAAAMAGEPLIESAPATELVFRVHTGPTVIVTGKSPILNVREQKTYEFRWVAVYVTAKEGWQLAVSQATRLPQ